MITVLRLGHRENRDKRITTHCGLVARAFGASAFILSGDDDRSIILSLEKVCHKWGGDFKYSYDANWSAVINNWKKNGGLVVHLTMYGIQLRRNLQKIIDFNGNILVIIGAEKVPGSVYKLADYNIAIGNQPHSEVAALAIFLDRLFDGKELELEFKNSMINIIPQERGKSVQLRRLE
jgi:tRNA (cytidine56-2'-O)-methyltransferase